MTQRARCRLLHPGRRPGAWARRRLFAVAAGLSLLLTIPAGSGTTQETGRESLAGQLLVATKDMRDPRFRESVVLMVEHGADGAVGVMVNRPMGSVPYADLFERLGMDGEDAAGELTVYYGGPVAPGRGFLLHSDDVMLEGSAPVAEGVVLTTQTEMLRALASGNGPADSLFALGYAGWSPGQLENEMRRGDWFVIPADPDLVFPDDPGETWKRARARRRIEL